LNHLDETDLIAYALKNGIFIKLNPI
jgi:hypothetical protein